MAEAPPPPPPGVDPVSGGLVAPEHQPWPELAATPADAAPETPRARPRLTLEPKTLEPAPAEPAEPEAPRLRLRGQPVVPQRVEREAGAPVVPQVDPLAVADAPETVPAPVLPPSAPAAAGVGAVPPLLAASAAESAFSAVLVPPPVVLPAAPDSLPPPHVAPAPMHIRAPLNLGENELATSAGRTLPPGVKAAPRPGRAKGWLAAVVVLALAGAGAWWFFLRDLPTPSFVAPLLEEVRAQLAPAGSEAAATPPTASAAPASAPAALPPVLDPHVAATSHAGKILERAADRIGAADTAGRDRRESLTVINAEADAPASPPAPSEAAPSPPPAAPVLAGRPAPVPATPPAAAEVAPKSTVPPSPAFRALVDGLRISGVFQGNPPRALIAGRTLKPGDVLDPTLGVVFVSADTERKRLRFRDRSGAELEKRY